MDGRRADPAGRTEPRPKQESGGFVLAGWWRSTGAWQAVGGAAGRTGAAGAAGCSRRGTADPVVGAAAGGRVNGLAGRGGAAGRGAPGGIDGGVAAGLGALTGSAARTGSRGAAASGVGCAFGSGLGSGRRRLLLNRIRSRLPGTDRLCLGRGRRRRWGRSRARARLPIEQAPSRVEPETPRCTRHTGLAPRLPAPWPDLPDRW